MKVISIKKRPIWKRVFNSDTLEVAVQMEDSSRKTVTIFFHNSGSEDILKEYIRNKVITGSQWNDTVPSEIWEAVVGEEI